MNVDYLVATYDNDAGNDGNGSRAIDALRVLALDQAEQLDGLDRWVGYGYRGWRRGKRVYATRDSRVYVAATGSGASDVALLQHVATRPGLSVARLDLQATLPEPWGADRRIAAIEPNKRYIAIRIHPANPNSDGHTLYIGAPSSRVRMRIYNKTAEAGITVDGYQVVRYELQLRDEYADRGMQAVRTRSLGAYFLYHARRMIDTTTLKLLEDYVSKWQEQVNPLHDWITADEESSLARRKRWIETSVIPALRRLRIDDPAYVDLVVQMVYNEDHGILNRIVEHREGAHDGISSGAGLDDYVYISG